MSFLREQEGRGEWDEKRGVRERASKRAAAADGRRWCTALLNAGPRTDHCGMADVSAAAAPVPATPAISVGQSSQHAHADQVLFQAILERIADDTKRSANAQERQAVAQERLAASQLRCEALLRTIATPLSSHMAMVLVVPNGSRSGACYVVRTSLNVEVLRCLSLYFHSIMY